jgi:SAM-dependent methyltransferase
MNEVRCRICGSSETQLVAANAGYSLVRCKRDGLVYVNPQPNTDELESFYAASTYFAREPGATIGYANYLADKPALNRNTRRIIAELKKLQPTGRFFDMGCAYGFALQLARAAGYEPFGNDLNEDAVRYAQEKLGLTNVRLGYADRFAPMYGTFDIVSMIGTIEHFQDPRREVATARKLLKSGGFLAVETVDFGSLIGRGTIKPPEHLYYFSVSTLKRLLTDLGFEVMAIRPRRGFNVVYFTFEDFIVRVLDYFDRLTTKSVLKRILQNIKKIVLVPARKFGIAQWVIPALDGQFTAYARAI